MDRNSRELKSDSFQTQEIPNQKRNYSIKNSNSQSLKDQHFSFNSKLSKENIFPNDHLSKSSKKKNNNINCREEKKEIKVVSSIEYQEKKYKNEIE